MYGFPDRFDMNKYVKGREYQVCFCLPASKPSCQTGQHI